MPLSGRVTERTEDCSDHAVLYSLRMEMGKFSHMHKNRRRKKINKKMYAYDPIDEKLPQ